MFSTVINAAGEAEAERRSRRANALDALAVMAGVLFVLWPLSFGLGILGHHPWVRGLGEGLMFVGFVWAVIGSPWWHGDSLASRGVSSPACLRAHLAPGAPGRGWTLAVVLAVMIGVVSFSLLDWPDAGKFFRLPKSMRQPPESALAWIGIAVGSTVAAAVLVSCVIRYDNLRRAFALAGQIAGIFLAYAALAAWLTRGPRAFAKFELADHTLDMAAHMFWGLIQQFTFTAFLATRLRKAFPPAPLARPAPAGLVRFGGVTLGGVIAAATLGPAMWLALRAAHGPAVAPTLLAGSAGLAFPLGLAWTHFFLRDRRRMLVATLTGSFFGLIHIDSYGLVILTAILGTTFAYAAMEDRFRNVAAFAVVHGLLGATVLKLFGGKGIFRITMSVGPWAVKHPTPAVMIFPLACLAAAAALAWWIARRPVVAEAATSSRAPR